MNRITFNDDQVEPAPIRVRITQSAMQSFLNTVGRHPPETFGMFGGYLGEEPVITDFRFCPPRRGRDGQFDRSYGHVNIDAAYMNFVIDAEWKPIGKYILGIGHSHPAGARRLSVGDPSCNEGDLVFMKRTLAGDDSPGRNWKICFAPIITFERLGKPIIDWFAVTADDTAPIPVTAVIVDDQSAAVRLAASNVQDKLRLEEHDESPPAEPVRMPEEQWQPNPDPGSMEASVPRRIHSGRTFGNKRLADANEGHSKRKMLGTPGLLAMAVALVLSAGMVAEHIGLLPVNSSGIDLIKEDSDGRANHHSAERFTDLASRPLAPEAPACVPANDGRSLSLRGFTDHPERTLSPAGVDGISND